MVNPSAAGVLGTVAGVELRSVAAAELRQYGRELRVDRGAVIALHEVLDDELPVGTHVIADPPAEREVADVVTADRRRVAEEAGHRPDDPLLERRRLVREAHPQVAEPFPSGDRHEAVALPVGLPQRP